MHHSRPSGCGRRMSMWWGRGAGFAGKTSTPPISRLPRRADITPWVRYLVLLIVLRHVQKLRQRKVVAFFDDCDILFHCNTAPSSWCKSSVTIIQINIFASVRMFFLSKWYHFSKTYCLFFLLWKEVIHSSVTGKSFHKWCLGLRFF